MTTWTNIVPLSQDKWELNQDVWRKFLPIRFEDKIEFVTTIPCDADPGISRRIAVCKHCNKDFESIKFHRGGSWRLVCDSCARARA